MPASADARVDSKPVDVGVAVDVEVAVDKVGEVDKVVEVDMDMCEIAESREIPPLLSMLDDGEWPVPPCLITDAITAGRWRPAVGLSALHPLASNGID